jgi:transcriptional regulator with XRE-family HTH domain
MIRSFIEANGITQTEIVRDLQIDAANVSRLVNDPNSNPKRERIDQVLAYFSIRLGRPVSYEEVFNTSRSAAVNE